MIKLLEDNTVLCSDGSNVNSGHPDKTECLVSRSLAEFFPYKPTLIYDRPDFERVIKKISFDGKSVSWVECDCAAKDNPDGRARLTAWGEEESYQYDLLSEAPEAPQKVIDFVAIVKTPEMIAQLEAEEKERIAAEEAAKQKAIEDAAAAKVERIRKQEEFQAAVAAEVERQLAAKA
jgi:hypothetical protein